MLPECIASSCPYANISGFVEKEWDIETQKRVIWVDKPENLEFPNSLELPRPAEEGLIPDRREWKDII